MTKKLSKLLIAIFTVAIALGVTQITQISGANGTITTTKTAAWTNEDRSTLDIAIEEKKETGITPTPKILFLGTLCESHGLTKEILVQSLLAASKFGDVHYELFRTDYQLSNDAHYSGDISMDATKSTIEAKINSITLKSGFHSAVYEFASILKNVTLEASGNGKTHYDYIIMEFDGLRMGHFKDASSGSAAKTTSTTNKANIDAAIPVLKEYYAQDKIAWIIPKFDGHSENGYPYNYTQQKSFTTSSVTLNLKDKYIFNDMFMDNDVPDKGSTTSENEIQARYRINTRNALKLLAPEDLVNNEVPNSAYLDGSGKITDTFKTFRERITKESGTGIWVYYSNADDVFNFLKKKLTKCNVTIEDTVVKGLTVTQVIGQYKNINASGNPTGEWITISDANKFSYTTQSATNGTLVTAYFSMNNIYGSDYEVKNANNVRIVISCSVDEPDVKKTECLFKSSNSFTIDTNYGDAKTTILNGPVKVIKYNEPPQLSKKMIVDYEFVGDVPSGVDSLLPEPEKIDYDTSYTSADTTSITKETYVFKGWYTDKNCTAKYTDGTKLKDNTTLYGKWVKQVTVTYHYVGDVPTDFKGKEPAQATIDQGSAYNSASKTNIKKDTYSFVGWYTDQNCTQPYTEGSKISTNTDLYGKWSKNRVNITYQFVNAPAGVDDQIPEGETVDNGTKYTSANTDSISLTHYIFKGWFLDPECTIPYVDGTEITTDTILYGKWTYEKVKVTYKFINAPAGVDDQIPGDDTIDYGSKYDSASQDSIGLTHYVFVGWFLDPECTIPYVDGTEIEDDTELYGKWETEGITVYWEVEGVIVETDPDVVSGDHPTYDGNVPQKPATDTATYTFSHWEHKVTKVVYDGDTVVYETTTFVAVFEEHIIEYHVPETGYNSKLMNLFSIMSVTSLTTSIAIMYILRKKGQ